MNSENLSSPPALPSGKPERKSAFAHQAAKGSWVSAVLVFAVLAFGRNSIAPVVLDLIALLLIVLGLVLGVVALFGLPRYGAKGILGPALAGILINGLLASIAFCNFFTARAAVLRERAAIPVYAKTIDERKTTDERPFRVVAPAGDWTLDESTRRQLRDNAFITTTLTKNNSFLRSAVFEYRFESPANAILEKMSAELGQPISDPSVKNASTKEIKFLKHKAIRLTYELTQNDRTEYVAATLFANDNIGWAILCAGPSEQKEAVEKIFDCYQPASSRR